MDMEMEIEEKKQNILELEGMVKGLTEKLKGVEEGLSSSSSRFILFFFSFFFAKTFSHFSHYFFLNSQRVKELRMYKQKSQKLEKKVKQMLMENEELKVFFIFLFFFSYLFLSFLFFSFLFFSFHFFFVFFINLIPNNENYSKVWKNKFKQLSSSRKS